MAYISQLEWDLVDQLLDQVLGRRLGGRLSQLRKAVPDADGAPHRQRLGGREQPLFRGDSILSSVHEAGRMLGNWFPAFLAGAW